MHAPPLLGRAERLFLLLLTLIKVFVVALRKEGYIQKQEIASSPICMGDLPPGLEGEKQQTWSDSTVTRVHI